VAAATTIDRVLRVAAASTPANTNALLFGLLEETRALRSTLGDGLSAVEGRIAVSYPFPFSV